MERDTYNISTQIYINRENISKYMYVEIDIYLDFYIYLYLSLSKYISISPIYIEISLYISLYLQILEIERENREYIYLS